MPNPRISHVLFTRPIPRHMVDEYGTPLDDNIAESHMSSESVTNIPSRDRLFRYGTNAVDDPFQPSADDRKQMIITAVLFAIGTPLIFAATVILGAALR